MIKPYKKSDLKTKSELREFKHRRDIIKKSAYIRDHIKYDSECEREEYENLCTICCTIDWSDEEKWPLFEKLTRKYAKEVSFR